MHGSEGPTQLHPEPGLGAPDLTAATAAARLSAVNRRHGLSRVDARLAEAQSWLGGELQQLEALLEQVRGEGPPAAAHLLRLGGKRVRPMCVILASRMGDGAAPKEGFVRDLAAAAELVHNATLLHDDVIDQGEERRGAPASRIVFGNSASVLAGDHLLVEALRLVQRHGSPTLLARLLDVIGQMVAAEALQLDRRGRIDADEETYLTIIRGKTAVLFGWAFEAGGTAAGLDAEQVSVLGRAGVSLGLAFQLVDDIIDVTADAAWSGKTALADLREGKLTWPLLRAMQHDPAVGQRLAELLRVDRVEAADAARVIERVRATGAVEEAQALARSHGDAAVSALAQLPRCAARDFLGTVVEGVLANVPETTRPARSAS